MRNALGLTLLALALAISGCALIGESPAHVGGDATLGDAARAARPDTSSKRRRRGPARPPLDVGYTVPSATGTSVEVTSLDGGSSPSGGSSSVRPSDADDGPPGFIGAVGGGGSIGGTEYDGFGEFGLDLGFGVTDRWRADLLGTVSPIQFSDMTIAGQSFRNEIDLNLDLTARFNLTESYTFMGAYPLAGVRCGTLFWDYAQPITVIEDGTPRVVNNDHINHFSVYGGFGFSPMRLRHLQIGTQLLGGSRFYSWTSHQGFSNTLFPPAGFVQVRFEAGYSF